MIKVLHILSIESESLSLYLMCVYIYVRVTLICIYIYMNIQNKTEYVLLVYPQTHASLAVPTPLLSTVESP